MPKTKHFHPYKGQRKTQRECTFDEFLQLAQRAIRDAVTLHGRGVITASTEARAYLIDIKRGLEALSVCRDCFPLDAQTPSLAEERCTTMEAWQCPHCENIAGVPQQGDATHFNCGKCDFKFEWWEMDSFILLPPIQPTADDLAAREEFSHIRELSDQ